MTDSRREDPDARDERDPRSPDESSTPRPPARPSGTGPYRDAREVLLSNRHRIRRRLEEAERAAARADDLRKELAYVDESLRSSTSSLLARVAIARPCKEPWEDMAGDDVVRHCERCKKDVYDLSAMRTAEAEALLARDGEACVRLRRRADGRVVTADCPPPPIWSRASMQTGAAVALAVAATSWATRRPEQPACETPPPTLAQELREELDYTMGGVELSHRWPPVEAHDPGHDTYWVDPTSLAVDWPRDTQLIPIAGQTAKVLVHGVTSESALAEMGLANGDVLVAIDGHPLESVDDFLAAIERLTTKGRIEVRVLRAGIESSQVVALRR